MIDLERFYKGRRILITGGLGFLGSNLAHALVEMGARVSVVDALYPEYGGNRFNVEEIKNRIAIVVDDIRNQELMEKLIPEHEMVFHIAAQTSHIDSMKNPFKDLEYNCKGTLVLLEAIRKLAPDLKLIYAGTRGQFGAIQYRPVDEKHPMQPTDLYGINKMAAEHYVMLYTHKLGLKGTSLRINNTYGPRHQMKHGNYGILNWFIRLAMEDKPLTVYGSGEQLRDYNYVDDVTQAFLLAGAIPETIGEVYNLGSGQPVTFLQMCQTIIKIVGKGRIEHVPWPEERKKIEVGDYVASFEKFARTTGWQPKISLEDGLARTVTFYDRYKEHYWGNGA
jgi:UDP-glucose 4-epimerase